MNDLEKFGNSFEEFDITSDNSKLNDNDIQFLNQDIDDTGSSPQFLDEDIPSEYQGLEGLVDILKDERKKSIIERFEPESLLNLQSIGLDLRECINDPLPKLASNTPAKVNFKNSDLLSEMVLLIKPYVSRNEKLELKIVPYINR